ncbi:MAG: FeoA family protein [Cyanobacteria bacterium J06621_3]
MNLKSLFKDADRSLSHPSATQFSLAIASVGDRIQVTSIEGSQRTVRRLTDMGIVQSQSLTLISRADDGAVIVARDGCRLGLSADMARQIKVRPIAEFVKDRAQNESPEESQREPQRGATILHLGELSVNQSGRIVGYEKGSRAYRSKLLSMGLTPETHFTLTRQAPMGDPVEIELRGFKLSLRKGEAAALRVETTHQEVSHV